MAAPEYVPTRPLDDPRSYKSPPRRPLPWLAERPGEVVGATQPRGERLGNQGPDQGYAYKLLGLFAGRLRLTTGEDRHDMEAGGVAVGLKRASLFGRAPVVYDLTVAFTIWGFLGSAPAELVAFRTPLFQAASHHYGDQRTIAEQVPEGVLRAPHAATLARYPSEWRALLGLG